MQGTKHLPGHALALLLATMLLAGCSPAGAISNQPGSTATQAPTATSTPQRDWQTYVDPTFGFHLDIPAILSLNTIPNANDSTQTGVFWAYTPSLGAPPASQEVFAEVRIDLAATTNPGRNYPCTQGTPITIGSGVPAYEDDTLDFSPPTSGQGGAHGVGGLNVQVVTGGVLILIGLESGGWLANPPIRSASAFRARYGAIWQHILNSFLPGPAVPDGHPCG
jgi:hypothetical protein